MLIQPLTHYIYVQVYVFGINFFNLNAFTPPIFICLLSVSVENLLVLSCPIVFFSTFYLLGLSFCSPFVTLFISSVLPNCADDKHRDNMAKHMPGLHSPMMNNRPLGRGAGGAADASSASSLPVSESEDDLNGKVAVRPAEGLSKVRVAPDRMWH